MTADDRPVLVFDVNGTLSDMSPLRRAFEEVGVPGEPAPTWFDSVLRAGMRTARIDRHGAPYPQYARTPDLRVSGVRGLAVRRGGGGLTA